MKGVVWIDTAPGTNLDPNSLEQDSAHLHEGGKIQTLWRQFPLLCLAVQATQSWCVQVCRAKFIIAVNFPILTYNIFLMSLMPVAQQQLTLKDSFILWWCADLQFGAFFQRNYRDTMLKVIFFHYVVSLTDNFSSETGLWGKLIWFTL